MEGEGSGHSWILFGSAGDFDSYELKMLCKDRAAAE